MEILQYITMQSIFQLTLYIYEKQAFASVKSAMIYESFIPMKY